VLHAQLDPDDAPTPRERLAAIREHLVATDGLDVLVATIDDVVVSSCYLNVIPNLTGLWLLGRRQDGLRGPRAERRQAVKAGPTASPPGRRDAGATARNVNMRVCCPPTGLLPR